MIDNLFPCFASCYATYNRLRSIIVFGYLILILTIFISIPYINNICFLEYDCGCG